MENIERRKGKRKVDKAAKVSKKKTKQDALNIKDE